MTQFVAFDEKVEVNGETVLAIVQGLTMKRWALEILKKNGIEQPQRGQWYNQQLFLNAFKEISEGMGAPSLFRIGQKIPLSASFPAHIDSIDAAMNAIDHAYHLNHRQGKIGSYQYNPINSNSGGMVCWNPYPCDFDQGLILAMANQYLPPTAIMATIQHDTSLGCRKQGSDSCSYVINW